MHSDLIELPTPIAPAMTNDLQMYSESDSAKQMHASFINGLQFNSSESEFDAQESDSDRHNDVEVDDIAWTI